VGFDFPLPAPDVSVSLAAIGISAAGSRCAEVCNALARNHQMRCALMESFIGPGQGEVRPGTAVGVATLVASTDIGVRPRVQLRRCQIKARSG
jgi:hypothetical protein